MLKKLIRNCLLGKYASSDKYIHNLRKKGICIGDGVHIYSPQNVTIDVTQTHLLKIGNYVRITKGVTILAHDYSWSVIKRKTGEILGNNRATVIGNNVFIGMNAIILSGTTIEDNTIIGAGSIVSGICLADSVYAGNPAKRICSLDEYIKKRRKMQIDEAYQSVYLFYNKYGKMPQPEMLSEYFFLFTKCDQWSYNRFFEKIKLMGNPDVTMKVLEERSPHFQNYEAFLEYCNNRMNKR